MKAFISTTFYGYLNYIISVVLIASPWIFGFVSVSSAALLIPIYMGWLQLIMAIFSTSKAGLIKQFPMQMHLIIDVLMGFFLAISPWLYNFSTVEYMPQLILGFLLFCLGIFTRKSPFLTKTDHSISESELTSAN